MRPGRARRSALAHGRNILRPLYLTHASWRQTRPLRGCSVGPWRGVGLRLRIRGKRRMPQVLFRNAKLLDPRWDEARGGHEVLVEGEHIKEVSDKPIKAADARVVDCGGRTLMPGLIDCHVHVFLSE